MAYFNIIIIVARRIHATLKPERDFRVANRLIGAALGVRIKSQPKSTNKKKTEEEETPVEDAWD